MTRRASAVVTGASGFIGGHLCHALGRSGRQVRALLRRDRPGPWSEAMVGDVTERLPPGLMTGIDVVYHLAGKAHALTERGGDEREYHAVNVEGTRRVVESALAAGVGSLVMLSSVKALGEGGETCLDESSRLPPQTPYGRSKLEAERIALEAGERGAMQVTVLRPALVYGPGVKGNLLKMLSAIDRGRFPPLPDLPNRRSMVHVEDVARAALLAAEEPAARGKVFILTDHQAYSTARLYRSMAAALGKPVRARGVPLPALRLAARCGDLLGAAMGRRFVIDSDSLAKLLDSAWYSSQRITAELGFEPTFTLETALPEIVRHYRARPAASR